MKEPKEKRVSELYDCKNNVKQVLWDIVSKGDVKVILREHNVTLAEKQILRWMEDLLPEVIRHLVGGF